MNIYVANLSWNTNSDSLQELFSQYGEVTSAYIINDRETGRSRGFGFVEMPNDEEGQKAIDALNETEFEGKNIAISVARPRTERPAAWREFGLYRKLCPPDRKRMSTLPIVLGKALVYGIIYSVTTFYILGLHYRLFHYPMNGATGTIVVFMLAYMAACIALGIAISTLFRYRENSLLLLLWTSIPLLMLSGVSYPREGIPDWLFNLGQIFPSSHGVNAFIRIQSMGASLSEVLPEIRMLCILALVYGGLACIGIHLVLNRADKDDIPAPHSSEPEK